MEKVRTITRRRLRYNYDNPSLRVSFLLAAPCWPTYHMFTAASIDASYCLDAPNDIPAGGYKQMYIPEMYEDDFYYPVPQYVRREGD